MVGPFRLLRTLPQRPASRAHAIRSSSRDEIPVNFAHDAPPALDLLHAELATAQAVAGEHQRRAIAIDRDAADALRGLFADGGRHLGYLLLRQGSRRPAPFVLRDLPTRA